MSSMISVSGVSKKYASGLDRARRRQSGNREGRDFRAARAERRRKDHADRRHLRHRFDDIGARARRRARHYARLSGRALEGRAWCRRKSRSTSLRRLEHGPLQPSACSGAARTIAISNNCCAIFRCGRSAASRVVELSGGMKRRVMIAKALSHEPEVMFLDEPTAGVDVNLRRDMWALVRKAARQGRHRHSDDALHRGGGGDGRPHRRHQRRQDHPRSREGGVDAQARQAPANADAANAAVGDPRRACRLAAGTRRSTGAGSPTVSAPTRRAPAFRFCCDASASLAWITKTSIRPRARWKIFSSTSSVSDA